MPTGVHRPKQPEIVKARLIAAGTQLLADGGAVSIGAVADLAGVTKGAVQHHFGTREDLLMAIYVELQADFEKMLAANDSSPSAAARYARSIVSMRSSEENSEQGRALLVATVIERQLASRWAAWIKDDRKGEKGVNQLIARLAADGLWLSETLGIYELTEAERHALSASIQQLAEEGN